MAKAKAKTGFEKTPRVWAIIRVVLALIFLWAFFDKMIGLGFSTCRSVDAKTKVETVKVLCDKSVAKGASPTVGFLKFGAKGPMKSFYNKLAGNKVVDFLFMSGLLLIGLSLLTGVGINVATVSGAAMMLMMWSAVLPPAQNPVLDDHIVYFFAFMGIMLSNEKQVWGLGKWWQNKEIVKKYRFLA